MKKSIVISVLTILVVASLVGAGTFAYFSNTESSTGNTFTAGTIDIAVDGNNPWFHTIGYDMKDLKPCETGTITFTITNVGTNPVVVWKHIGDVVCDTGLLAYPVGNPVFSSEPEAAWAAQYNGGNDYNRIDTVINYDLSVNNAVIFTDADGLSVDDIQSMWMPLGQVLGPGESRVVVQSYHMRADTGNWAQGDKMTFTIDLYAEQRLGNGPTQLSNKLFLDNKTGDPDWYFIVDQAWGILTWSGTSSNVTGNLLAQGLTPGTGYSLITYTDPWPSTGLVVIGSGLSDGTGKLTLANLTMPSPYTGKIWLVLSGDVSGTQMGGWNPTSYLFEANKVSIP